MLSNRPYLLRAFYQWIVDSACTPIIVIDTNHPRSKVPAEYADGDEIVFNVSPDAVRDLKFSNDFLEFKASFSGIIHLISAPINAVLAVYAEENNEGLFFDSEDDDGDTTIPITEYTPLKEVPASSEPIDQIRQPSAATTSKTKPFLKLVE